jgi:hypothetical protein
MAWVILAVLIRPWLWPSVLRFVPPGWWKRWPPNPMPPKEYLEFRLVTAYGDPNARPSAEEAVRFLSWCRGMNRVAKGRK